MEKRIGPYVLVRVIGEGGMGIVYEAQQEKPIKRRVALKVIKAGMDTKEVVARFEAERQALALMDHPGIAKVLDGGETEAGRPYFVMEFVEGVPLQAFAKEKALELDERLRLFIAICRAVEHAHQKGIIHRDLKPSNILVNQQDGEPTPRIIDFGIAKATAGRRELTDKTLLTSFNQVLGTPTYMSPEQLDFSGIDLDTRTDIYALGVLLYELLTEVLPFDQTRLAQASASELEQILYEEEPPLPSKRDCPELKGDLDWIVMKAMAKSPGQRYASTGALARDVTHFLADEPVSAAAPTTSYVLSKFAKRHRLGITFVASMLALMIAGSVISVRQAIRATRAERAEEEKSRLAMQRQQSSDAMLDFITLDLLGQARPSEQADRDIKLTAVLEGAAERVNQKFASEPRVRCFMNLRLASIFENLARFEEADKHATEARSALDQLNEQGPPLDAIEADERRVLDADITYQFASHHMGRADYAQALPILKEALQKNLVARGKGARLIAEIHEYIGLSYHGLGQMNEAIEALETASRLYKEMNPDHLEEHLLTMTITLAQIYQTVGNPAQSVAKLEEAKGFLKELDLGDKDPLRISTLHNVALVHMRQQEPELAVPMLEECLNLVEEVFGNDHLRAAKTQHSLAACYTLLGRHEDALPLYQSSWGRQVEIAGEGNEWSLIFLRDLTQCVASLGKRDEWSHYLDRLIDLTHTHFGDNHYLMEFAMKQYARLWEGDPSKLSELETRLSGEEAWPLEQTVVLLSKGSRWRYHSGSEAPVGWMGPDVDVNDWAEGSAPLGYGEGFIATELSFGPDSKQKWASAFFRAEFSRSSKRSLAKLRVKVRRDDGILLYLNGKEILRQHLPDTSTVAWTAYATQEVGGIEEALYYVTEIDPKLLKEENVLAAQVHQCNGNSSDLSFDLSMEGLLGPDDVE